MQGWCGPIPQAQQRLPQTIPLHTVSYTHLLAAETVYVGFWTDKGTCDASIAQFLNSLTHQQVFLFGTAGFGGAPAYFAQILSRVQENLGEGIQVSGTYMCQGRMPQAVRDRYEAMEESPRRTAMLEKMCIRDSRSATPAGSG